MLTLMAGSNEKYICKYDLKALATNLRILKKSIFF